MACMTAVIILSNIAVAIHGTAVITSTSPPSICNETSGGSTVYLTPGDTVTIDCTANNSGISDSIQNTLAWTTPDGTGLSLLTISQSTTSGRYSFSVTSFDDTLSTAFISSNITFIVNQMDDERSIRCTTTANGLSRVTCTLLVYTTPNVTTNLNAISVTYNSTTLSWTPPTDTGGYPTVNYIIEVTGSNSETIITTDNSIIYTNVEYCQTYTFTVRANNSIGEGNSSNTVTVRIPCEVPPQPSNINICLNYTSDSISISWNCPVISNIDTTPPVTNYSISVNMVDTVTTSGPVCNYVLPLNGVDDITVNVTANSIAGSSQPISDTFNGRLLQNINEKDITNTKFVIKYTTVECLEDNLTIEVIYNSNTTAIPYIANTTSSITLSSLMPGAAICYALKVKEFIVTGLVTTLPNEVMTPSDIIVSSSTSTTCTCTSCTCTPSATPQIVNTPVAISVPITAVLSAVVASIVSSLVTYYCCWLKSKGRSNSYSPSGPYDIPPGGGGGGVVPTGGGLELKDNMAYGQVTGGSGPPPIRPAEYETVHSNN